MLGKGLPNMGNTCYLNSVLQCLRYSKPFVFLLKEYDCKKESPLMRNFIDLLYSGASKRTLNTFIHNLAMSNTEFKILRQCDAHELYLYLIDTLYTPKTFSFKNVFKGELQSSVQCKECQHTSITSTPFISISLQMVSSEIKSVKELVDDFCSKEELTADIQCDRCCQKRPSTRQFNISKNPDIVVIHLKRFQGFHKITTPVQLDRILSINNRQYQLYAMCNHSGGVNGGHYTAACKKRDGTWIMCNDDFITDINSLPMQSSAPYVLFYSIKDKK